VFSCAPREALNVLDGLLDNDTLVDPKPHHVDTPTGLKAERWQPDTSLKASNG